MCHDNKFQRSVGSLKPVTDIYVRSFCCLSYHIFSKLCVLDWLLRDVDPSIPEPTVYSKSSFYSITLTLLHLSRSPKSLETNIQDRAYRSRMRSGCMN